MAARRQEGGLPTELTFRSKPQIAVDGLQAIAARSSLLGRWVAADALYGNAPAFRDASLLWASGTLPKSRPIS